MGATEAAPNVVASIYLLCTPGDLYTGTWSWAYSWDTIWDLLQPLIRMRMICGTLKGLSSLCSGTYALHTDMHSFRWSQGGLRRCSWVGTQDVCHIRIIIRTGHHQDHDGCGSWWGAGEALFGPLQIPISGYPDMVITQRAI